MYNYSRLKLIAEIEFSDIVLFAEAIDNRKLRLHLIDNSYVDIFYTASDKPQKYSYHWERTMVDGTFYRHDNIPDGEWSFIHTFPKHFHDANYENLKDSFLSSEPPSAIREFLEFVRNKIK